MYFEAFRWQVLSWSEQELSVAPFSCSFYRNATSRLKFGNGSSGYGVSTCNNSRVSSDDDGPGVTTRKLPQQVDRFTALSGASPRCRGSTCSASMPTRMTWWKRRIYTLPMVLSSNWDMSFKPGTKCYNDLWATSFYNHFCASGLRTESRGI